MPGLAPRPSCWGSSAVATQDPPMPPQNVAWEKQSSNTWDSRHQCVCRLNEGQAILKILKVF